MSILKTYAVSAEDIVIISDTNGDTLGQLLSEGKSVKLDVDVTYSESISIKSGNSSILDINGKKLTLSKNAGNDAIIGLGDKSYDQRGSLKVIDTSSLKNGVMPRKDLVAFFVHVLSSASCLLNK